MPRSALDKRKSVVSNPGSEGAPGRDGMQLMSSKQEKQQSSRKNRAYQELKREIEQKRRNKEKVWLSRKNHEKLILIHAESAEH